MPITLQTMGIALAGLVLGPWRGAAAAALYVVLGLLGLPIFAGFVGGFGVLAGPSAGYLLAWPLTALVTGFIARIVLRRGSVRWRVPLLFVAAIAGSILVTHPAGIVGMSINLEVSLREAFFFDIVFWPGDVIKSLVAAGAAALVHRSAPGFWLGDDAVGLSGNSVQGRPCPGGDPPPAEHCAAAAHPTEDQRDRAQWRRQINTAATGQRSGRAD